MPQMSFLDCHSLLHLCTLCLSIYVTCSVSFCNIPDVSVLLCQYTSHAFPQDLYAIVTSLEGYVYSPSETVDISQDCPGMPEGYLRILEGHSETPRLPEGFPGALERTPGGPRLS